MDDSFPQPETDCQPQWISNCTTTEPSTNWLFEIGLARLLKEVSMAQNTPVDLVRQASTLSTAWGVLLIVFGMVAIGSPFLAAVAVNVAIARLLVLAGVVHLMLAFRAHGAGSMIWKLLVGIAYFFFGAYLIIRPAAGGGIAHVNTGIALLD
jgi:uncharacterized membrane protein HdeD (DUF308 family)